MCAGWCSSTGGARHPQCGRARLLLRRLLAAEHGLSGLSSRPLPEVGRGETLERHAERNAVGRLRPNLLLAGVDADDEPDLPGRALAVGGAVVRVLERRTRCVVTTVDPDSGARDLEVLRHVRRAFDMRLALDCWVVRPGTVRVGDEVRLVDVDEAEPAHVGGWILGTPYDVPSR